MAIPILFWMLECTGCGARLVVHDSYLKFIGTGSQSLLPGAGYGGPPLPDRHTCSKGCAEPMMAIGSIGGLGDPTMRLHDPYVLIEMTKAQSDEWRRLVQEADYLGDHEVKFTSAR